MKISKNILGTKFNEFVKFIKDIDGKPFTSFKESDLIEETENYKYSVYNEAREKLGVSNWKISDIGSGKIHNAVSSASVVLDNNLINWRKKDDFSKIVNNKELEKKLFNFYTNKISDKQSFENFITEKLSYQFIAYLFFIKDRNQYLPILQTKFDEIFEEFGIDFRTGRQLSWENYQTFIDLIRQIQKFLLSIDRETTLLDAHSFMWVFGNQMKNMKWGEEENDDDGNGNRDDRVTFPESMFNWKDIVWIKNVLRNHGHGWAYDDKNFQEPFYLNWPNKFRGSVLKAESGDLIVLFQKPKVVNGTPNNKVFLTHLVSPIDEIEHEDLNFPKFRYCRFVKLIAIANPINSIPNPGFFNFHKPNRGQTHPIINLGDNREGIELSDTQQKLWELFSRHISPQYQFALKIKEENSDLGEMEGDPKILNHINQERRTRSSRIVKLAKFDAIQKGKGFVECECCKFDFRKTYGGIGIEYIECHHKIFLSQGKRITRIQDLALVCSNCHRMLHRKNSKGEYHSVEELSELIKSLKAVQ